jgi:hypothetical protein
VFECPFQQVCEVFDEVFLTFCVFRIRFDHSVHVLKAKDIGLIAKKLQTLRPIEQRATAVTITLARVMSPAKIPPPPSGNAGDHPMR